MRDLQYFRVFSKKIENTIDSLIKGGEAREPPCEKHKGHSNFLGFLNFEKDARGKYF